ncbi:MAG: LamG-like jellyroll fold domain-containing protein [Dehalococcoidia bacterium]|jgi:hypothetical protein
MLTRGVVFESRLYAGAATPPSSYEDKSRYHNNGTFTDVTWTQLKSGLWVLLESATTSVVTISDADSLSANELTALVWANVTIPAGGNDTFYIGRYLIAGDQREWSIIADNADLLSVQFGKPADGTYHGSISNDGAAVSGVWQMIGLTYSGGVPKLFVNGIQISFTGSYPASLFKGTAPVTVGNYPSGTMGVSGNKFFVSLVANVALSTTEIWRVFNAERSLFGV